MTCPARTGGSIHWPGGKSMKRMAFSERIFRCSLVIASAFPAPRRCWNAHSAMQDGPLVQSGQLCRRNTQNPLCSCTKIYCAKFFNSTSLECLRDVDVFGDFFCKPVPSCPWLDAEKVRVNLLFFALSSPEATLADYFFLVPLSAHGVTQDDVGKCKSVDCFSLSGLAH